MGFFGDMLENSVVKKFSTKTVDDFCSMSCEASAFALLSAAELATSELGESDNYESMLAYRVILSPHSASSNDCMAIFDIFLDDYTKIESLAKKQLAEYERGGSSDGVLKFIRDAMKNRLMAMRIILLLLADGADKVQRDICKRFYTSLHEGNNAAIMMDAVSIFIERKRIEGDVNPEVAAVTDDGMFRLKNIVASWDSIGMSKHFS